MFFPIEIIFPRSRPNHEFTNRNYRRQYNYSFIHNTHDSTLEK